MLVRKPPITNVIWNWLNYAVSLSVALYITRLLIERLGTSAYGMWVLIGSLLGYYGLLNFGIDSSIVRYVSKNLATNDKEELEKIISTGLAFFSCLGVAVCLTTAALAYLFFYSDVFFHNLFNLPQDLRLEFSLVLAIAGIGMAISFGARVFVAVMRAAERYDLLNAINIGLIVGRGATLVLLLRHSVITVAIVFASFSVLSSLVQILIGTAILRGLGSSWRRVNRRTLSQLAGFGIFTFLTYLSDQLIYYTDALVIGHFMPMRFVAFYNLGNSLITYFRNIVGAMSGPFFPLFSKYEGAGDKVASRTTFLNTSKIVALLSALLAGNLIGSGRQFMQLWVGEQIGADNVALTYWVLLFLLVPAISLNSQALAVSYFYGTSRHQYLAKLGGLEGLFNLVLSITLVQRYGILGVAAGTAIPMIVTKAVYLPRYLCQLLDLSLWGYTSRLVIAPIGYAAILGSIQLLLYHYIDNATMPVFLAVASLTTIACAIFCLVVYLSSSERDWLYLSYKRWRGADLA